MQLDPATKYLSETRAAYPAEFGTYFLLVFICPTWPQFAHLRRVPEGFVINEAAGDVGEFGESTAPSMLRPFCLSRAIRRSLLR